MGLIAQVASTGKDTNCTRLRLVELQLLTMLVTHAINPINPILHS